MRASACSRHSRISVLNSSARAACPAARRRCIQAAGIAWRRRRGGRERRGDSARWRGIFSIFRRGRVETRRASFVVETGGGLDRRRRDPQRQENRNASHGHRQGEREFRSGRDARPPSCSPPWASTTRSWPRPASCWPPTACTRRRAACACTSRARPHRHRRPVRRDQGAGRRLLAVGGALDGGGHRMGAPLPESACGRQRHRDPSRLLGRGVRRALPPEVAQARDARLRDQIASKA